MLPQTWRPCVFSLPQTAYTSDWTQYVHTVWSPMSETAPLRFSSSNCTHSLSRDNWSVSGLTFSYLQYCLSYGIIVEERNLFIARVCPLWPVALPSVTLRWLHLPLAGLPHVWFWKRVEPAERLNLKCVYNSEMLLLGGCSSRKRNKVTLVYGWLLLSPFGKRIFSLTPWWVREQRTGS